MIFCRDYALKNIFSFTRALEFTSFYGAQPQIWIDSQYHDWEKRLFVYWELVYLNQSYTGQSQYESLVVHFMVFSLSGDKEWELSACLLQIIICFICNVH